MAFRSHLRVSGLTELAWGRRWCDRGSRLWRFRWACAIPVTRRGLAPAERLPQLMAQSASTSLYISIYQLHAKITL